MKTRKKAAVGRRKHTARLSAERAERSPRVDELSRGIPEVISAEQFRAYPGFRRAFHIRGLLPHQGKLTFAAPAKSGKSFWAMQVGLALASGDCEFLGFQFGPATKVLYLQSEIDDGEVQDRLNGLLETAPQVINRERAQENLRLRRITTGPLNLMDDGTRQRIDALVKRQEPGVVILDPLIFSFPGLEENNASDMSKALGYLSAWSVKYGCAVIHIHHTGKNGQYRGSSVFDGWPETALQATETSNAGLLKVKGRFRCTANTGPWHWRGPTKNNSWFSQANE